MHSFRGVYSRERKSQGMRLASEMLITSFDGKPQASLIELAGGDGSPLNDNAGRATRTTAYARLQSKSCGQRSGRASFRNSGGAILFVEGNSQMNRHSIVAVGEPFDPAAGINHRQRGVPGADGNQRTLNRTVRVNEPQPLF